MISSELGLAKVFGHVVEKHEDVTSPISARQQACMMSASSYCSQSVMLRLPTLTLRWRLLHIPAARATSEAIAPGSNVAAPTDLQVA
jgi:hypothetical protein